MVDYGHELQFGYFLVPEAADPAGSLQIASLVDRVGYDLIGIQDHQYQPRCFDTLALIGWILSQTDTVRAFADVHDLPLRPPAMLANAASTLDVLSGGRFELGTGSGGFLDAAHSMGAPARTPAESLAALEEAIVIIRAMWASSGAAPDRAHAPVRELVLALAILRTSRPRSRGRSRGLRASAISR